MRHARFQLFEIVAVHAGERPSEAAKPRISQEQAGTGNAIDLGSRG